MYRTAIKPDDQSNLIEVQQTDYYTRKHIKDGSVVIKITESKSQQWDTLETAQAHQERMSQITLDKISINTLISSLEAIRDNPSD
jgi:hypothetical protein|tara:strand:+ start:861 stop:1115 length:255 start_codon:yes stop_codon:yes gene_type:complete